MHYKTIIFSVGIVVLVIASIAGIILHNRAALSPERVTQMFYDGWIKMAEHPNRDPIENRLHLRSTYVSDAFGRSVERLREREDGFLQDPVLCGDVPEGVSVELIGQSENNASVSVTTLGGDRTIDVMLINDRGWWRVDEIDCPPVVVPRDDLPEEEE